MFEWRSLHFLSPTMFPVKLLAFVFISSLTHDRRRSHQEEEVEEEEESESRKYDVILRRGDVLQVSRTLVTHFGIYLGRDRVVHFIPDILPVFSSDHSRIRQTVSNFRLLLGVLLKRGSVRVDSVDDFAHGSQILVNTMDEVCSRPPLQGEEVARRAEKLRGDAPFSLLWYNCEHFVMFCRYGVVTSFQTFQFCKTLRKLLLSRRVAKATAMLSLCLLVQLQPATISCSALLLLLLLPFILWMAS